MGRVEGGDQCLGSSEVCGVWTGLHTTQHWAGDQVGSTSPTTARYLQVPVDTKTVSQPQLPTQPSAEFLSVCTEWVSLAGWSHYLGHPELHLFARELLECQAYLWSWWCKTPVMWADNSQGDTGRARCSWSPASLAINTSPAVRHRLSCTIIWVSRITFIGSVPLMIIPSSWGVLVPISMMCFIYHQTMNHGDQSLFNQNISQCFYPQVRQGWFLQRFRSNDQLWTLKVTRAWHAHDWTQCIWVFCH